jgi:hypothetical protein
MNKPESAPTPTAACAHCRKSDCEDHCPASAEGEHSPRMEGTGWVTNEYGDDSPVFEAQIVCGACGAEGHAVTLVRVEDLLDDVQWDSPGRRRPR